MDSFALDCKNTVINEVVYYRHIKGDFVSLHKHSLWEVLLYCDGRGRVGFDNEEYEYSDNTVVVVSPEMSHSENSFSQTDVYCCELSLPEGINLHSSIIYCNESNSDIIEEIKKILWNMANLWFKESKNKFLPPLYNGDLNSTLEDYSMELILCLINLFSRQTSRLNDSYKENVVGYAQNYIRTRFAERIDYRILAEKIGYSYEHFRAFFKKVTGITLKQYQLGIQLSQAKFYLSTTNKKVKWVAKKCGFNSDIRFMTLFKEKFNISPSDYRKMMRTGSRVINVNNN